MWSPIPLDELRDLMRQSETEMEPLERRLWGLVATPPEKWALPPWGDLGGGFWVVGVLGRQVLWYNDIEYGFNVSQYERIGVIKEYRCNQDQLEYIIWQLVQQIEGGRRHGSFGPPEAIGGGTSPIV
jgi:hypothetical protein